MTKEVNIHYGQYEIINAHNYLTLDMAGQGAGKSVNIAFRTYIYMLKFPQVLGLICANTYQQLDNATISRCKEIWGSEFGYSEYDKKNNPNGDYTVGLKPPPEFTRYRTFKEYHNKICFRNGKDYLVASLDNYKAIDGVEVGHVDLDETKDTRYEAIQHVILGRCRAKGMYIKQNGQLSADGGEQINPICIHTSPDMFRNSWLIDMFNLNDYKEEMLPVLTDEEAYIKKNGNKKIVIYPTHLNIDNLPSNYIENQCSTKTDNEVLRLVYGYPFGQSGDSFYPSFSARWNVKELILIPNQVINITVDFNLRPYMTMLVCQTVISDLYYDINVCDELLSPPPHSDTRSLCQMFINKYGVDGLHIRYFGDASGTTQNAGYSNSNYDTLREVLSPYISTTSKMLFKKNTNVMKRRDLIERILQGKLKHGSKLVRLFVDKKCIETINDFTYLKLGKDGLNAKYKETAKDENGYVYETIGHTSDALEYLICKLLEAYL